MSVAGIMSSAALGIGAQMFQSRMQKVQTEFQQLGKDLQSGNLSAAQSDFATLQQLRPATNSTSSAQSSSPLTQDFNQLATDLKAGNITAAKQDYAKIQQDFQNQASQSQTHHHHHHHSSNSSGTDAVSQLFSQLGTALQAGNLTAAQTAYATMQRQFQQYAQLNAVPTQSSTNGISVNA